MKDESAISEVVGAILLISIVTLAMAIVSVGVLSQPPPQEIPQINAIAVNESRTIFIDHTGGDSVSRDELLVRVNNQDIPPEDVSITGPGEWPWSIGKTLRIEYPGPGMPESVQLIYRGGSSSVLILNAYFVPPQITGGPTVITTVPTQPVQFYRIAASAGPGGSISPSGVVTVGKGGSQAFYITPERCYRVAEVRVNGVPQVPVPGTYTFSNVQSDQNISAGFAYNPGFTITPSAGAGGSITPSSPQTVNCGGSSTFTFTPSTGYFVSNVIIDGTSRGAISSPYTFSDIDANHTILVQFSSCPPPGAAFGYTQLISPPLSIAFTDMSSGIPNNWNWNFGDGTPEQQTQNPVHTYATTGTYNVTLKVANNCGSAIAYQTVTVSPTPTTTPTVTPTQGCGYISGVKWNDANANGIRDIGENGISGWQMNCFKKQGNNWIPAGSTVTDSGGNYLISGLTYSPADNYKIIETVQPNWVPISPATGESMLINLNPAHCFEQGINFGNQQSGPLTINSNAGNGGIISPSGSVQVPYGQSQTFIITPQSGYSISNVMVDGQSVSLVSSYTFTNVVTNHTISASFSSTPTDIHHIYLNAAKRGYIESGGYMQFTVTGPYSQIKIDKQLFELSPGDSIRLTIGNDGSGTIFINSGQIDDFSFHNIMLTINGEIMGTGQITKIYISSYSNYVSTLDIVVPSKYQWTDFRVEYTSLIYGDNSSAISIYDLKPSVSTNIMNLNAADNDIFYEGGGSGYTVT